MLNFSEFEKHYITAKGKFHDEWASHLPLFPFTTNLSNDFYDKNCNLLSTVGAYFRKLSGDADLSINSFEELRKYASSYLINEESMDEAAVHAFLDILRDVFYQDQTIHVTNSALLQYVPLIPREGKRYHAGHLKFAQYLFSMGAEDEAMLHARNHRDDLFTLTLRNVLQRANAQGKTGKSENAVRYIISSYIKKKFHEDYLWLMQQKEGDIIKYLPLMFHFYICISFIQTMTCVLEGKSLISQDRPAKLFMVLNSERVSMHHKAIGVWEQLMGPTKIQQLFGRVQALDILNCLLSENGESVGFEPEIRQKLEETPFEENRESLERLLQYYDEKKMATLNLRQDDFQKSYSDADCCVGSYDEFLEKLQNRCVKLTPQEFRARLIQRFNALFKMRLVQTRRGRTLPVLDNEMLIFIMLLATRGKRMKLQSAYNVIQEYGIHFNQNTKLAIEEYLLKMNLLERKSDSGEAKFVHIHI